MLTAHVRIISTRIVAILGASPMQTRHNQATTVVVAVLSFSLLGSPAWSQTPTASMTGQAFKINFQSTSNTLFLLSNQRAFVETRSKNLIPFRWTQTGERLCLHDSEGVTECWDSPNQTNKRPSMIRSSCNAVSQWQQIDPAISARSIAQLEVKYPATPNVKLASIGRDRKSPVTAIR